jgi:hypothetical protein
LKIIDTSQVKKQIFERWPSATSTMASATFHHLFPQKLTTRRRMNIFFLHPTNVDSQAYDITIKIFSSGTPEEWLVLFRNFMHVFLGQNITNGPGKYLMMQRLNMGNTLPVCKPMPTLN